MAKKMKRKECKMGGFEAERLFLLHLFGDCFQAELEDGTEFSVCLVDLMQYLASTVKGQKMGVTTKNGFHKEYFDVGYVTRTIDESVSHHINKENDPKKPIITRATIFMLDTIHNVPGNKSAKQRSRDRSECEHMNEALFQRMQSKRADNLFIFEDPSQKYPLEGDTIWRSVNLKLQLYRLLTHHILHARVKPNTVLVMDDGLAFSEKDYEKLRKNVVYDLQLQERTEFEKEFVIHQIMTHSKDFITRFMVWDDAVFRRFPSTGIGEADIKILSYIKRGIGLKKFLVVNQDTDLIFILLLHMKHFLKGDENDDKYEVWLDTRSPNPKSSIKPYRFINIKRLYYAINKFFSEEFPSIRYPIETFCFIVFSTKTDFTREFSPSLQIGPAFIWSCFSQLHTLKPDYVPFSEKSSPPTRIPLEPGFKNHKLHSLLNNAIQYDMIKRRYILKHKIISQFYYFLCQTRLVQFRKMIGLSIGYYEYDKSPVIPLEELLIFGREIQERVEFFQQYEAENLKNSFHALVKEKKPVKLPSCFSTPKKASLNISITPSKNDEPVPLTQAVTGGLTSQMKSYLNCHKKNLKELMRRESINEYFGVLTENDMLCRIYRIEWYLSYCTDGWKELLSCSEKARQDSSLSQWGWEERLVTDKEEFQRVMNSSYYQARYNPQKPCHYDLYEILECNKVSHKRLYF